MRKLVISKSITPREYESLGKYFSEIDKIGLISIEEEVSLARRIKQGDEAALEQLTKTNLRFVISVAKQYQNQGLTLGDLINEGNIGLISAARRYDESKGFKFISYAVWWIRQSILKAIAQHASIVRLPLTQLHLSNQVHKAISVLEQDHHRTPTAGELAEYLDTSVERVQDMVAKADTRIAYLEETLREKEQYCLQDILPNDDPGTDCYALQDSVMQDINCSLNTLSKRDRELVVLFFGLGSSSPLSLEELGRRFNITKEHVYRLKEGALKKLRNCSNAPVLISYLA